METAALERWKDRASTPFSSPEWLGPLYTRHAAGEPWPLELPHGVAPLVRTRKGPFVVLRLAGGDYEDVVGEPECVPELLDRLGRARGWTLAHFRGLRAESVLLRGWPERPGLAWARVPHRRYATVRLPASWAEYERGLGKKLAYKLRAAPARRAAAFGSHELRRSSASTLQADLDALVGLHTARWAARGEPGIFRDQAETAAFRAAAARLLAAEKLWLYTLWLDGRPASALFCLVDARAAYYYIGGIDVAFQKHHPGKVLIARAIADAIDAGMEEFDFLSGGEAYKQDWANSERAVYRLVAGRGLAGALAVRAIARFARR